MKKAVISLTILATLGVAAYFGSQLHAQNPSQAASHLQQATATAQAEPLRTRIAVVNLQQVIRQYRKWSDFEQNYKNLYAQYQAEFERAKAAGVNLKSELDKATDEATREKIQNQLKDLERQVQDRGDTAKKHLTKLRDDQAVQMYQEVEHAVQAYARANGIEMVLHFNDAVAPADLYHAANIERKLQTGACMPMYVAPGMNITEIISRMLNDRLGPPSAPAPGAPR